MSKAGLLIDMDGVLGKWTDRFRTLFEAKFPDRKMLPHEKLTKFYLEDLHPKEWHDDFEEIRMTQGFYLGIEPIEGAIESLKDIENNCLDFIDPFICSSPEVGETFHYCHSEKAEWVQTYLGSFWAKRLILTKDKTLVRGHLLIDDKPVITGAMTPTWSHLIYDQPWSREAARENNSGFAWEDWPTFRDTVLRPNFGKKGPLGRKDSGIILVR